MLWNVSLFTFSPTIHTNSIQLCAELRNYNIYTQIIFYNNYYINNNLIEIWLKQTDN